MRRLALAAAAAVLLSGCGLGGSASDSKKQVIQTTTTRVEVVEGIGDGGFDPRQIYDREAPGVVTVISLFGSGGLGSLLDPNGGDSRGDSGLGSGFVLNGDGEIVTNAHVVTTGEGTSIKRARAVFVEFGDGNRVQARIVGHDPNADIALLEIPTGGLRLDPLPLGSSSEVRVGSPVAAMGSPFGEEQSLSVGVVSAVDRDIESLTDFRISGAIQTDAAINPGNSGGPLVDAEGRVIGVNQQIKTRSGGGEGVGFAVPVDLVKRSVDQLRRHGEVKYAYLGVASQRVYPQLAERFDLNVEKGAWLQDVTPGGPADKAGLRAGADKEIEFQASLFRDGGDVITRLDGKAITDSGDLAAVVALRSPGDVVDVEYLRDGERRKARVTLGERPLQSGASSGR
jgi:S1-C subfamily serine protease